MTTLPNQPGAPHKKEWPRSIAASEAAQVTQKNGSPESGLSDCQLLRLLQQQLARHGYSLFPLAERSLFLSHPRLGLDRVLPDLRAARAFLRIVEGR